MSLLRPTAKNSQGIDTFQQLVDSVFGKQLGMPEFASPDFHVPATDISETESGYLVSTELPGMRKKDINISLHDGVLSIEAETNSETDEGTGKQLRRERRYGKFVRRFTLGENIDQEKIDARFEDGVLILTIGKPTENTAPTPKSIPVN